MRDDIKVVKKAMEKVITNCWKLLNPKVFATLAELIVDGRKTIIKTDRWYTKY